MAVGGHGRHLAAWAARREPRRPVTVRAGARVGTRAVVAERGAGAAAGRPAAMCGDGDRGLGGAGGMRAPV